MQPAFRGIRNFRDLEVWKLGMGIVKDIYRVSRKFPREEQFGLTVEARRSARSVPSNIAEGFNKDSNKDYARYLGISLGSCAELETQIEVAREEDYINETTRKELLAKAVSEQKMLRNLRKKVLGR